MKKMMLLAGLLVLGAMGYAEGNPGNIASAEFKAEVNVVERLTVNATNINFGNVAPGTTVDQQTKGTVTITGAKGKNVKVEFLNGEASWDGNFNFDQVGLTASATVDGWEAKEFRKIIELKSETEILNLSGRVTVGDDVPAKDYVSNPITVKVTYEGLN